MPRTYQSAYAVAPLSSPHADAKIRQAEELIQAHYAERLRIADLAAQLRMTERTFIRRFRRATGRMHGAYLQSFRVAVARNLLESSTSTVQSVALAVGYGDVASFRRLFRRETGIAPARYRAQFGSRPAH